MVVRILRQQFKKEVFGVGIVLTVLLIGLLHAERIYLWDYLCGSLLIGVAISIAGCILALTKSTTPPIRITILDIVYTLHILYIIINAIVQQVSLEYLYPLLVSVGFYWLIRITIGEEDVKLLWKGLTGLTFFVIGYAALQVTGWVEYPYESPFKYTSFFDHPGPLAGFLAVLFPVILYTQKIILEKHKRIRKTAYLIPLVVLLILIFTHSRAGILAALAGAGVYFCLQHKNWIRKTIKPRHIALLCITFVIFLGVLFQIRPVSVWGRLFVWKISANVIADHPFFGVGYGHFSPVYMQYQGEYFETGLGSGYEKEHAQIIKSAFNEFIRIGVELGWFGILLFLTVLVVVLISAFSRKDQMRSSQRVALAAFCSFLIFSFFSYPLEILPLQLLFSVTLALCSMHIKNAYVLKSGNILNRLLVKKILLGITSGIFTWHLYLQFKKVGTWQESIQSIAYKKEWALKNLENLYAEFPYYGPFLYDFGTELAKDGQYNKAIPVLEQAVKRYTANEQYLFLGDAYKGAGDPLDAEKAYYTAHFMMPSALPPLFNLMVLYHSLRNSEKAKEIAKQIITIPSAESSSREKHIKKQAIFYLNELSNSD